MTDLVNAFMGVFDPVSFALITGGTIFGIIFGAIPGLTATLAVILLIPLSYGLEPTQGISMLVGVYIGGISGGVVAAVLLGMPGTPSSMVTVLDGFALAKQGRAGKALGAGVTANLAGSFIGWLFLIALAPQVARFALEFGPIENTAVLLFGFTAVISLSGGSITKGICMTALGMAFSTVGVDPISSMERNTLGFSVLTNGISQMPAMIGLFVVAQAFAEMDTLSERFIIAASRLTDRFMSLTELRASLPNFIRSGLIGTAIGILFFVLVLFAALTSSIALTESAVSTFQDELGWGRKKSTAVVGVVMLALGTLSSLGYGPLAGVTIIGMQFLDFFDFLTNSVMMPIAAIAICLLVSRVVGVGRIEQEVLLGEASFRRKKVFNTMIRFLCPFFAAIILLSSVANALGWISM